MNHFIVFIVGDFIGFLQFQYFKLILILDGVIRFFFYKLHICSPGNYPSESAIIFRIKCLTWPQLNNSSLFPVHYLPAVQTKVPLKSAGQTGQMAPYALLWYNEHGVFISVNLMFYHQKRSTGSHFALYGHIGPGKCAI